MNFTQFSYLKSSKFWRNRSNTKFDLNPNTEGAIVVNGVYPLKGGVFVAEDYLSIYLYKDKRFSIKKTPVCSSSVIFNLFGMLRNSKTWCL